MHRPLVLQIGPLSAALTADLASHYQLLPLWREADPTALLQRHANAIRAIVTSSTAGCTADLIRALPELQAICSWGVGYETVDVAAAHARGIQVSNTPDVLNDCVADLAWGLMLATARRLAQGDRYVRAGRWQALHDGDFPLGARVSGKRLGILGLGRIGMDIAKRGTGFDMQIRYYNRNPRPDVPWEYAPSLVELARWADFLVVACVGGPATYHLVNRDVIDALGAKGTLINISRGPVIDETAMVAALREGRLGAAGLDVFEHEPVVPADLLTMDHVVLLPHIGSASQETRRAMEDLVVHNLEAFFATGKLITPVPPSQP